MSSYPAVTSQYSLVTVNPQPADTLTYTGPSTVTDGASATLSGTLTDPNNGNAGIDGDTLTFTLAPSQTSPQTCTGVTSGPSGTASCTISTVNQPVGSRTVQTSFAGDANNYAPNTLVSQVTVNPPPTPTLTYTGATVLRNGTSATLSATIVDPNNGGVTFNGDTLTFALAPSQGDQTCIGTVAANVGLVHHQQRRRADGKLERPGVVRR